MNHKNRLKQRRTALDQLCRHWESRRRVAAARADLSPGTAHAFSIALAREAGTQGTAVAQEVGNQLGWHVYDHELLERIAQEMGVRAALLESVDERQQSWLLESVEAFLAAPAKSEWEPLVSEAAYVRHLVEIVLALGMHGECVIVGRGAAFIFPSETTLRVLLVAPVKQRIATLSRTRAISEREAASEVRTIDRERVDSVRDHFLKDPTDPRHYDLVLNAGRLPIAAEAGLIIDALRRLQACAEGNAPSPPRGERELMRRSTAVNPPLPANRP
jgi:cytidylate kinase